jgi:hypothetical protein
VNVGFECKTSDKLSRRAFPRGYTESLEERVRILEAEVRELKDLLDEKDEKIDMLSRIHSHSSQSHQPPRKPSTSPSPNSDAREEPQEKEETFKVQQSPLLLDDENQDAYFEGSASGRTLVGTDQITCEKHYAVLTTRRGLQAESTGDGQVMLRCQLQRIFRHGLQAVNVKPTETHHIIQGASSSGV